MFCKQIIVTVKQISLPEYLLIYGFETYINLYNAYKQQDNCISILGTQIIIIFF